MKMSAKKKSSATKLKVELKDLKPKKDAKGGGGLTATCAKTPALTKGYCSGVVG
jgi:hypothetical protein